jgi:hypothetical protein
VGGDGATVDGSKHRFETHHNSDFRLANTWAMSDDEFDGWDESIDWNAISAAYRSPPRSPPRDASSTTMASEPANGPPARPTEAAAVIASRRIGETGRIVEIAPMSRTATVTTDPRDATPGSHQARSPPGPIVASTSAIDLNSTLNLASIHLRRTLRPLEPMSKQTTQPVQNVAAGAPSLSHIASGKRKRDSWDDALETSLAESQERPNKKPVRYESPSKKVRDALEAFDDELSCPM